MTDSGSVAVRRQVILAARILPTAVFLLVGRDEVTDYSG
jgi:hypothetical protein